MYRAGLKDGQREICHMRVGMIQLTISQPGFRKITVHKAGSGEVHIVEPGASEVGTVEFHPRKILIQDGAIGEVDALQRLDRFLIIQCITSNRCFFVLTCHITGPVIDWSRYISA